MISTNLVITHDFNTFHTVNIDTSYYIHHEKSFIKLFLKFWSLRFIISRKSRWNITRVSVSGSKQSTNNSIVVVMTNTRMQRAKVLTISYFSGESAREAGARRTWVGSARKRPPASRNHAETTRGNIRHLHLKSVFSQCERCL